MREQKLNGFSLMEMMIVLLIVAVVAAASAPLVTRKMSSTGGSLDSSPWVYTGVAKSIAYNMDGSASSAIIGASKVPNGSTPKLYIESSGNEAQIGFGRAGSNDVMSLVMDTVNNRVGFSNATLPSDSVAIGTGQTLSNNQNSGITAIGYGARAEGTNSIVVGNSIATSQRSISIGYETIAGIANESSGTCNVAIGDGANAATNMCIAIGTGTTADVTVTGPNGATSSAVAVGTLASANGENAIAIGSQAQASGFNSIALGGTSSTTSTGTLASATESIAIGPDAKATKQYSVAIGPRASAEKAGQITLGDANATVYIPGKLEVVGEVKLHYYNDWPWSSHYSDKRLKNIGDKFTAGINELSKLDFFHYTFKKDETKTPHVGVIAQDLQEVFPDAVTKGDDGFLRIRWEDMFYAAINAIKELNTKIIEIANNLTSTNTKVEEQDKIIKEQQKIIDNQQKTIEKQQKSIDDLIRRMEKVEKTGKI